MALVSEFESVLPSGFRLLILHTYPVDLVGAFIFPRQRAFRKNRRQTDHRYSFPQNRGKQCVQQVCARSRQSSSRKPS